MIRTVNNTQVEILIKGRLAMFTDPLNRITAEKISYEVPTYSALQGVMRSIYSDPCIEWFIDECRVLNPIRYEDMAVYNPYKENKGERVTYHYLSDCAYIIRAHFDFNVDYPELSDNWSYGKHMGRLKAAIREGGRMNVNFGVSECQAYIADIPEGGMNGYYDNSGIMDFGLMFHSYRLPNSKNSGLYTLLWNAVMTDGIIHYCTPDECPYRRKVKEGVRYIPSCSKPDEEARKDEFELGFVYHRRKSYQ